MKDRILAGILAASCIALVWALIRWPLAVPSPKATPITMETGPISFPTAVSAEFGRGLCDRRIAEVSFDGQTFAQCVDAISAQAHVSIIMKDGQNIRINFDSPSPNKLHLSDTTVGKALAALIGASGENLSQLTLFVARDKIIIAPWEGGAFFLTRTEVYNVRDLIRTQQKLGHAYPNSIEAIKTAIAFRLLSDDVKLNPPGYDPIDEVAGLLVITETDGHHRMIAELLSQMRHEIKAIPLSPP